MPCFAVCSACGPMARGQPVPGCLMERLDAPGPNHRRGPRPLLLHLMLATLPSSGWQDVLKSWSDGSPDWTGTCLNPEAPLPGLPDAKLLAGIAAYRRHPFQRRLEDPPEIWREGATRLLDYGPAEGHPVVFVPSLVNRAYILDLLPERSMLRYLAANGVRPLLLDWGFPGEVECDFTLTDYVAGRLVRALSFLARPVDLVGYCMGGLMALGAAQFQPGLVARLGLLATPWDFWAADRDGAQRVAQMLPLLEPAFVLAGSMPIDALQTLFSLLDPASVAAKYRDFAAQDQASARAEAFVAIEDWLNDGVPLAAPVAREVLGGWYGRNTPSLGHWRIAGLPVRPDDIAVPSFHAIPGKDRIVPPESAMPLAGSFRNPVVLRPRLGHVGMVAGASARIALWDPLLAWLLG
jgi:polyhydroxyalkanoate synthase